MAEVWDSMDMNFWCYFLGREDMKGYQWHWEKLNWEASKSPQDAYSEV